MDVLKNDGTKDRVNRDVKLKGGTLLCLAWRKGWGRFYLSDGESVL